MNATTRLARSSILVTLAVAALVVAACSSATVRSRRFDLNSWPTNCAANSHGVYGPREGLAYFLPKGYVHIVAELQKADPTNAIPRPFYKVTVVRSIVPDSRHMFLLQPQLEAKADDGFNVTISNGLLTSLNSSNVDQTVEVFKKLGGLAGVVAQHFLMGFTPAKADCTDSNLPPYLEVFVDPVGSSQTNPTNLQGCLEVKVGPLWERVETNWAASCQTKSAERRLASEYPVDPTGDDTAGVFYRPLLPYTVTVTDKRLGSSQETILLLPGEGPILSLVPRRTPLTSRRTSVVFDQGVPTGFTLDRNSPAVAWASLPLEIAKAFLSVPAELIQLRVNLTTNNAALTAAQAASIQSQLSVLQQQLALQEFLRTNPPAGGK